METKNLDTKYCVGLGEILFDVLPTGSQLGGAPANFAYHAGQHGLHSVAVSAVGKDVLGDTALRILDEKKLKYVMPEVDYPTGTVQVQLDKEGVPTYDIKRNVAWDNIPFTDDIKEIAANAGAVCWGSLAQRSEVSRKTIYTFLDHTPEDCLKIFDFFLPSVPVPESHRIRKGAVVEVVTKFEIGFMALFLFHGRKNVWQFLVHIVPGDVDASMMFQIPVDAHGNIDPGVASDDDRIVFAGRFGCCRILAISCLVYLEEILV